MRKNTAGSGVGVAVGATGVAVNCTLDTAAGGDVAMLRPGFTGLGVTLRARAVDGCATPGGRTTTAEGRTTTAEGRTTGGIGTPAPG